MDRLAPISQKVPLTFGFHQGTIPLTTPTIHFRVSDVRLDISLICVLFKGIRDQKYHLG